MVKEPKYGEGESKAKLKVKKFVKNKKKRSLGNKCFKSVSSRFLNLLNKCLIYKKGNIKKKLNPILRMRRKIQST